MAGHQGLEGEVDIEWRRQGIPTHKAGQAATIIPLKLL